MSNSSTLSNNDQIIRLPNGRIVGKVSKGIFIKRLKASQHFLRVPPAIAFDISTLVDAEKAGASNVEVEDTESGKTYSASMGVIWGKGREIDRGWGKQWALTLDHWRVKGDAQQLVLPF